MNVIAEIQFPLPDIDLIKIYRPIKEQKGACIYPVRINSVFCYVRKNNDAMLVKTHVANIFSNEVWNLVGNMIDESKYNNTKRKINLSNLPIVATSSNTL